MRYRVKYSTVVQDTDDNVIQCMRFKYLRAEAKEDKQNV